MELSRRHVLSIVPAAGLVALVRPGSAAAAPSDLARLLANTVTIFTGTDATNARPELAAKIAAVGRTARTNLAAMAAAGPEELFAGLPLGGSDPNLVSAFQKLYEIALATRTPGADLFGDTVAGQRVLDGLVWLHDNYYGDQSTGYYGNWFSWEIAIS